MSKHPIYCKKIKNLIFSISFNFKKLQIYGGSLSPVHLRRKNALSLSYYALFQGWLLLGKPPSCLCIPTSMIILTFIIIAAKSLPLPEK